MTHTIALLNMKGGVGKTTLAVNIASHSYSRGRKRVLLIDLDPQFNASQYLMDFERYDEHRKSRGTVADLLIESPVLTVSRERPRPTLRGCLYRVKEGRSALYFDLLPSDLALAHVVKNPAQMEFKLEKLLEPRRSDYDLIFIDCPPTDSVLTTMALTASDFILVPVRPDRFSILGYALVDKTLRTFRRNSPDPHNVEHLGVIFTHVSGASPVEKGVMAEIRKQAATDGSYVFDSVLPLSQTFLRAIQNQTPAYETKYARNELKDSIKDVVHELQDRIAVLEADGAV